ncbi:hypothetical protein TSAR_013337 [Trichomalopsis sarcophagae]|uniref:Uncharacterized protein n=1 Tax=Trichomalopsis sarcophagae TaxID=543379 RepID=A0A232EII1_9HYME|nr:hypothetical protein TSAR_013337 [Trichomalopsis sarcophagae]
MSLSQIEERQKKTTRNEQGKISKSEGRPTLAGGRHQKGEKERKEEKKYVHEGTSAKNKNSTRKPQEIHTKPDALVIKAAEENSYADILRKMKADPNSTVLGNSENKIRKTVTGDLLLELRRTREVNTQELQKVIKAVLVNKATINSLQHKVVFEIKDLDMLTSKQDILEAVSRKFSKDKEVVEETSVKTLRKPYGDTQTAVVQLPAQIAQEAISWKKLKVVCVN